MPRAPLVALVLLAAACAGTPTGGPDAPFVVTPHELADAMLRLASVTARDVVYDLGSGDGRLVIAAARVYGARGVGVEIDHNLVEISRQIAHDGEVDNKVTFIEGDMFTTDISAATVVALYLSTSVNRRLEPKLRRELRSGARIVSHQFPIGDWTPSQTIRVEDEDLFLWIVPPY